MRTCPVSISLAAAFLVGATSPAPAQTGANPGFSRKPKPSLILINSFNSVPGSDIHQVFHVKLATDRDGTWTTCLTTGRLPAFWGGDGRSLGVVTGTFDPYRGTFTVNTEAKALNSTADDRNLTLDPTGLWAIFDRPDGVCVASRARTGTAFGAPRKVAGFGSLRDVMPALAPVGGRMRCFYTDRSVIWMQDIDLAHAKLGATKAVVSRPLQRGAKPLQPTPLIGADGDAEGLFLAEEVAPHTVTGTGDADPVWAADLDPKTPPVMHIQRSDWQPGGAPAGGFLSFAHDILPRFHVMHSEVAWLIGDVEKPGGRADIQAAGVNFQHPTPLVTPVWGAAGTVRKVVVPGIGGWFALNLPALFPLGVITHTTKEGLGTLSFPVPSLAGLKGVRIDLQGVVIHPKKPQLTFTNTACLRIE